MTVGDLLRKDGLTCVKNKLTDDAAIDIYNEPHTCIMIA